MLLKTLLKNIPYELIVDDSSIEIKGIEYDSRRVKKAYIFVAIQGFKDDGLQYASDAVKRGASLIVGEKESCDVQGAQYVRVDNTRKALADLSSAFYGNPSRELTVIGITGTNGKTTTSYFTESIFNEIDAQVGLLGTISYKIGNKTLSAPTTTPQSSDLHMMMRQMVEAQVDTLVMEVSSHALELERVRGCEFDVALYTNLTPEHMDFHKNMESYCDVKAKLFRGLREQQNKNSPCAIVNADDPYAHRIIENALDDEGRVKVVQYGIKSMCQIRADQIKSTSQGTSFIVKFPEGKIDIRTHLLGIHNIYNILAAFSIGYVLGIRSELIARGIENVLTVPGRFEKIDAGQSFIIVVDYAHTSDALERLLSAAKQLAQKRIITVFGCGGERDREKRPVMGEIASRLSDYVIITSDNPRSEDPERIALDIEVGIKKMNGDNYTIIIDRRRAIEQALTMAERGDIVLIAGKGHENYQILKEKQIPFDDREITREIVCSIKRK